MIKKRFLELAERAWQQNIYTYTNFLSPLEISEFTQVKKELGGIPYTLFGGFSDSERQLVRFGSEETNGYEGGFPIKCIHVRPAAAKFSDALTHRDFLGALLNLGIERDMLGDIRLKDNEGYVYCMEGIADFLAENLTRVKHTTVVCTVLTELPQAEPLKLTEQAVVCGSGRIDAVISKVYGLSRQKSLALFPAGRVFLNGAALYNNSQQLKLQDVVTVRGFGKFIFGGEQGETRKGKRVFKIYQYNS